MVSFTGPFKLPGGISRAQKAQECLLWKEINRIKIIQDVVERRITTRRAAEHLGISDRQCRRLLARYREGGPLGMASRRCGMRGNRQLPPGLVIRLWNRSRRVMLISVRLWRVKSSKNSTDRFLAKKLSGASWCGLAYGFPKQRAARIPSTTVPASVYW